MCHFYFYALIFAPCPPAACSAVIVPLRLLHARTSRRLLVICSPWPPTELFSFLFPTLFLLPYLGWEGVVQSWEGPSLPSLPQRVVSHQSLFEVALISWSTVGLITYSTVSTLLQRPIFQWCTFETRTNFPKKCKIAQWIWSAISRFFGRFKRASLKKLVSGSLLVPQILLRNYSLCE